MGVFGGGGGGGQMMLPPMSAPDIAQPTPVALPAPPPPVPSNVPTPVDPAVLAARDAAKKKAAGMAGYASTITTSGQGVLVPANTTAGTKQFLG